MGYGLKIIVPLLIAGTVSASVARGESVADLEKLVSQWVSLRKEIAAEKRGWQVEKKHLQAEAALLRKKKQLLIKELSGMDGELSKRTEFMSRQAELTKAFDVLEENLPAAESALRRWKNLISPSLDPDIGNLFMKLPGMDADPAGVSPATRMQVVMAIYARIESIQNSIHLVREIIDPGTGIGMEMNVLYIGLSRAFALSNDDAVCSVGTPRDDVWIWEPHPELADRVRTAIRVYRRRVPVRPVMLPLSLAPRRRPSVTKSCAVSGLTRRVDDE